ncbi:MAG: M23 family metallopeptidase [Candidatus Levybacteria bacterium]|nr:M23 family metallopeptidase [Candidatus Levybacteria bacterium]
MQCKKRLEKGQQILNNPFEFILDCIVRAIAYLFIPFPLAAEVLVRFRGMVLAILLNAVLLIVVLFITLFSIFTNPSVIGNANANTNIPIDGSFIATDIPLQNPLGGQGLSLVKITAGFMDPNYSFFGSVHTGVDFVPNEEYYLSNKIYKETGVVVYATMNGTVNYFTDKYGSHTVEVTNSDNSIKVIVMHLNSVFVATGEILTAGKPVGTMGNTGFSTGEHLHYEIRVKNGDGWIPVNPLGYIQ